PRERNAQRTGVQTQRGVTLCGCSPPAHARQAAELPQGGQVAAAEQDQPEHAELDERLEKAVVRRAISAADFAVDVIERADPIADGPAPDGAGIPSPDRQTPLRRPRVVVLLQVSERRDLLPGLLWQVGPRG